MLQELSDIQEEYRSILIGLRQQEDRSFEEAIAASEGMDDEALISCACVILEIANGHREGARLETRNPSIDDIMWAQEFIDHLDTLGKVIVSK